jgi:predicted  nucleic acid-binding Zn-ribbon protein
MNMTKFIPLILPIVSGLAACSSDAHRKYQDVEELAHPPRVQAEPGSVRAEDENDGEATAESAREPLGDKVYQLDSKPATLRIKLPFKKGWYAVRLALKQLDADIVSYDREEGVYVLNYKPEGQDSGEGGLLQGFLGGLLNSRPESSRYQVTVKERASETEVTVSEAKSRQKEKYIYNPDGYDDSEAAADPEVLFKNLFKVLKEDVVLKPAGRSSD